MYCLANIDQRRLWYVRLFLVTKHYFPCKQIQQGKATGRTANIGAHTTVLSMPYETLEQLRETFDLFDKDGDGKIDARELGDVLRMLKRNPTNEEIKVRSGTLVLCGAR